MNVGKRIRELREEQGLLQDDLARRAGVARNTVSRIERGRITPTITMLEKLARGLGVAPGILLAPSTPKAPPPKTMEELLTRAHVGDSYLTMSPAEISNLIDSLSYEDAIETALKIVEDRRAVRDYLTGYEGTPEYEKLTARSYLASLMAITSAIAIADAAGDTERAEELKELLPTR